MKTTGVPTCCCRKNLWPQQETSHHSCSWNACSQISPVLKPNLRDGLSHKPHEHASKPWKRKETLENEANCSRRTHNFLSVCSCGLPTFFGFDHSASILIAPVPFCLLSEQSGQVCWHDTVLPPCIVCGSYILFTKILNLPATIARGRCKKPKLGVKAEMMNPAELRAPPETHKGRKPYFRRNTVTSGAAIENVPWKSSKIRSINGSWSHSDSSVWPSVAWRQLPDEQNSYAYLVKTKQLAESPNW